MKTIVIFILVVSATSWQSFAVNSLPSGVWLPEKFVSALASGYNPDGKQVLYPFANIIIRGEEIWIRPFGNEAADRAEIEVVGSRVEVTNVAKLINSDFHNRSDVLSTKYFLSYVNDQLVLSIVREGSQSEIRFVNKFKGFVFLTYDDTVFRLRVNRKYCVGGTKECMSFTMGGEIKEFPSWTAYDLIRDRPYFSNERMVTLVNLQGPNSNKKCAVEILDDVINIFEYTMTRYEVVLSEKPLYSFHAISD